MSACIAVPSPIPPSNPMKSGIMFERKRRKRKRWRKIQNSSRKQEKV
jgi:hypothetical protein